MKKKQIEKIPYLGLKKPLRKKGVDYVGVTAVKIIGHEKHFFLEVYENKQTAMKVPVIRIVCTKKDFGSYFPEKEEWTRQKIYNGHYYSGLIWEKRVPGEWRDREKKNVLYECSDRKRIQHFFKDISVYEKEKWWLYIKEKQKDIMTTAREKTKHRKYERRQQALKERGENTRTLPEQELLQMAEERIFKQKHYLFYKKKGSFARIACYKCGGVTEARWKGGISYESQFQRWMKEPREGHLGNCPMCGAQGEFKCQGKVRSAFSTSAYVFLGQKYKETGFVMRYIELSKEWQLGLVVEEKGTEMFNAQEILSGVEIARAYFEEGKKLQMDYHKHSHWTGKDFWDDCNLYGNANISVKEGMVLCQTYEEMEGTLFQYSGLKEYMAAVKRANPIDYLARYQETPQIEMLMKLGLVKVVKELVGCRYGIVSDDKANRPDQFLGIRKDKVKLLMNKKGDLAVLEVLQAEKRLGENWSEEQIGKLAEIGMNIHRLDQVLQVMTVQKLLNRIQKYAGCEFGTDCSTAIARLTHTANTYLDYLTMRQTLGYDLTNTVYQQPRDLTAAHNAMITESNEKEMDERIREAERNYPDIRKHYRVLRKRYFFEDEQFVIRPARSAEEIIREGRTLHHCVGGNNYLRRHHEGTSIILVLRFRDKPSEPYITVEIEGERIQQWHGRNNTQPDKGTMQKWLNDYVTRLKCSHPLEGLREYDLTKMA